MTVPTDSTLRSLDAAGATLTVGERERAAETLERILATAPSTGASTIDGRGASTPARPSRRRLVLLPTTALSLAVAAGMVQGNAGDDAAYASWTPTPTAVTSHDLDAAKTACNKKLRRWVGDEWAIDPDTARIVLSERRGDHVALLYRREDPENSTSCLVRNQPGSTDADVVDIGSGGSSGRALKAPARGYTQGAITSAKASSITDGAVGDAVVGVTIHAGAFTVEASVQNGRYAAWWPGPAFDSGPPQPSGAAGPPRLILSYDLTLTDGTVIPDAQPTLPLVRGR